MRKKLFIIALAVIVVSCTDTADTKDSRNTFTIATWNVQNLFDSEDDGTEYSEYRQSSGWTDKAYKARLEKIKTVFTYFSADAAVLNEVENEKVVRDIISAVNDFEYYTLAGADGAAIRTAVISRYPITATHIHGVTGTRPILEAVIETPNGEVNIFAVHGKSKKEGEAETAAVRRRTGEVLAGIAKSRNNLVIIAGDFNEEVSDNNIFCDTRYMEYTDTVKSIPPVPVSPAYTYGSYYNPYLDPSFTFTADGTYFYNGSWEYIDNIAVSYSPDWSIDGSDIVFKGILKNTYGKPASYNRNLLTGVSDHLPVWLRLKY